MSKCGLFSRAIIPISAVLILASTSAARADEFQWERYSGYPDSWYRGFEAKEVAANVMSHQSVSGGWPKNIDTGVKKFEGDPKSIIGTFEDGATFGEIRFLARLYRVNNDDKHLAALDKALDFIVKAQYPTGGWPLTWPPPKTHDRHITFNDFTMVNLLVLLREFNDPATAAMLSKQTRDAVTKSFDRGVECLLKCQIEANGALTGWCSRHDEKTLEPRPGREHEPVSISARETAVIARFLMTIDNPDAKVIKAVHSACEWLDQVKLPGMRLDERNGDIVVVRDDGAVPMWSRFYEIGSNRPVFATRDGTLKYKMSDIEQALRLDYTWYGGWGWPALEMYATWKDRSWN